MAGLKRRDQARAAWLLGTVAIFALAIPSCHAQSASAIQAQAQADYRFDIPAKPLAAAIADVGAVSGWRIAYPFTLPPNLTSKPLAGSMTPPQAIARMLAGTGLSYRVAGQQSIVLMSPAQRNAGGASVPGAIPLDTINVQGDQQSPYGPGVGYTATRSVTGTKSDTPIIETPQSISVVTKQQIEDQQPQDVNQALRYTPGIVPELVGVASANNGVLGLILRGFTPEVYLDGLENDSTGHDYITPYLLNRIEVLSGPASVLFGQASPGGIVNLTSKMPTESPLHEVIFGIGSYGHIESDFDLSGPIDKDGRFLYRLTGTGFTQDTQTNFAKQKNIAIAPAFTWRPDSDTTFTILGKYINTPDLGAYSALPAQGTVLPNPNGRIPTSFFAGDPNENENRQTLASIGYQFDHRFDNTWSVQQNFRYSNATMAKGDLWTSGFEGDLATLDRYLYDYNYNLSSLLVDTRAQAKFATGDISHTAVFGADYKRYIEKEYFGFNFSDVPPINAFSPVYGVSIPPLSPASTYYAHDVVDQTGAYAQDQISWGRWRAVLGGREDWASTNGATTNEGVTTPSAQSDRAFTWRAGLVYLFDNGLAPYASYSTSFQPQVGTTFSGAAYVPTTGQQYEAGIKYQPPGSNSFITAAAYNLTEQNVLTPDPDPTHFGFSVQTGEIRARGVELQAHASVTESLSFIAAYTFTDAINTKSNTTDTTIDGVTESTQGKHPVGIPEQMASLWGDYTFHQGPLKGFGLAGGVRYLGPSYGDDVNSFTVPGVTLFDAALHYDLGDASPALKGFKLQVNVSNLFDKTYVASCTNAASGCFYGLRRTVLGTLKYTW